jgi:ornithine cyclodeaminase
MLILTRNDIRNAVNMKEAIAAVRQAFASSSAGRAEIPLRTQIDVADDRGVLLYMPGYLQDLQALGVKIVSVFVGNRQLGKETIQSTILLQDTQTGESLALMDGVFLTALRTGAASGAATQVLARENASTVAIFGAGQQARTQLEAMAMVRDLTRVFVFDPNPEAAAAYVQDMKVLLGQSVAFVNAASPFEAVQEADIVVTATVSKTPVFPGSALQPGVHINGIGSYNPSMQELDETTIQRADKLYVDNLHAAVEEAGDLIVPLEKGLIGMEHISGELGEVFIGEKPGREHDSEITVFKTVGFAALDMIVAQLAYQRAIAGGYGTQIDLAR